MTASEGSFIGLAEQTAKGTPNVTDAEFQYLLLLRSGLGIDNMTLPLDMEVGGGAFQRSVIKAGVTSGGPMQFIPRPSSIGKFLKAYFGNVDTTGAAEPYAHAFTFGDSQFSSPYFTLRNAPGGMFGHQYQDCRLASLGFEFRALDFVRAAGAFIGGTPKKADTAEWSPIDYLDKGPQFVSVVSEIEVPTGSALKVLQGSVVMQSAIPLDEQWIVGSYSPDDFAINQRAINLTLRIKVADDGALYNQIALDPASGSDWAADLFKAGDININLVSDQLTDDDTTPFSLNFQANGDAASPNVVFGVNPLDIVPGRQVTMDVSGTFLADPSATDNPITITLTNDDVSY